MKPRIRKLALTVHVTVSVGWIGAVLVFLALSVIGLTSETPEVVRAAYLVMDPAARLVLIPLALASLITGIVQSVGTTWGLFRHYWVIFKLVFTTFATVVLVSYMPTFAAMAEVAGDPDAPLNSVKNPSPVIHAVLALLVLLITAILGIYKPAGMTRYGWRKQEHERSPSPRKT